MHQNVIDRAYALLSERRPDWGLEQPFYVDRDFFELEMQVFFRRQWLFAAMTCEIPRPGDWLRVEVGRDSVIVIRGKDGEVKAFHNTCRHRGSRICLEERGSTKRLVCPYHQWSYDLDGQLIGTRLMGDDFDRGDFQLAPVAVGVAGGYIFINFADEPSDFEPFRQDVEPYLLPHGLDDAKVACTQTLVEKANWKLVIENNRECYHCVGSHPELMHIITEFDDPNDPRMRPEYKALVERKAADWDRLGIAHAHTQGNDRYRAVRLPFTDGRVSMTADGKPGCSRLLGDLTDPDLGSVRLMSLPNTWNHIQADHAVTFRVLPIGPEETLVTTHWLVHKDAREGVDYQVDRLREIWAVTNDQDRLLAENNHLGIRGSAYRPGPYSELIEGGTRDFIRWYAEQFLAELAPLAQTQLIHRESAA
ncbi:aromatic ring-hydroxylating dioxygenase subunit alpha [Pseudomonas gingeri]|uniref:aromatic ring-hydroxylating oxygenase subunit alpha n=1 Tax=Pseudomonas TaxID=286 RepID=UPI0015A4739D|nr:aromatic ring-hydroxylating dioxygenase subunit alpha [Pseudomonas gingeri]NVZ24606.1 aromatic ring-hydroxylating dioxygenase subunit alpha [Pseudomonas gingeri]